MYSGLLLPLRSSLQCEKDQPASGFAVNSTSVPWVYVVWSGSFITAPFPSIFIVSTYPVVYIPASQVSSSLDVPAKSMHTVSPVSGSASLSIVSSLPTSCNANSYPKDAMNFT